MRVADRKLVVVLTLAAILQMAIQVSCAFQLWPIRLTRTPARQDRSRSSISSEPATSPPTPTSTQMPPIELLFEVDPDDLDQGAHKHSAASSSSASPEANLANGTLILEDLVNQFERHFNTQLQAANLAGNRNSTPKTISSTTTTPESTSNRLAKYKQAASDDQTEPTTPPTETFKESVEFDRDESNSATEETLADPDDDRHIQYDTIIANSSISSEALGGSKLANDTHQVASLPLIVVSAASKVSMETPAEAAAMSSSRGAANASQAQARSMSGTSSRLPQHSKAPYASYNLFDSHRHGAPASQQPRAPSPSFAPASSPPLTQSSQSQTQSTSTPTTNSTGPDDLASGITKISSSLLADSHDESASMPATSSANTTTKPTTTPAPIKQVSLVDRLQAYLHNASQNQLDGGEIERAVSKLVPINELTELEPLPDTTSTKTPVSERQFVSVVTGSTHRGKPFLASPIGELGSDQDERDPVDSPARGPTLDKHSLKNVIGELLAADEHPSSAMLPQMETIEMLSNQIRNSDSSLLAGSANTMAVHQHRERSPPQHLAVSQPVNRGELNGTPSGTFAASLINVTAPMVLPLSASEAMEAALAAAQQQQHQSAYLGGQLTGGQPSPFQRATSQPQRSSYHAAPARNSVYMRPANANQLLRPGGSPAPPTGQLASGFRSPLNQFQHQLHLASGLPTPSSYLNGLETATVPSTTSTTTTTSSSLLDKQTSSTPAAPSAGKANSTWQQPATTNGFITGPVVNATLQPAPQDLLSAATGVPPVGSSQAAPASLSTQMVVGSVVPAADTSQSGSPPKRAFNLSRVEHISAECSNDLIRTVIVFNGTFKGIIYSSNYVRDPNCLYVNGTGKTRYDFSIRLNQCGTIGRQELHQPTGPDEVRRRDQVMWNSLSIQYNPMIEQEWDEHFRVSCEYGSDFWKTISFNPFNVETNTGAPVVFTVDPPQCQMEILKGHGMVGPRQEAVTGPVTVGDPLTLLIHMRSEKAGYDILVKNCVAHNGGQQRMQLIDSNGCVINERFISPFRGTYNDNELKHVTLYSYLKAFRFTGSPVLYLECEVHMCQSACPPQMCYWRRLSKRSLGNETSSHKLGHDFELAKHSNSSSLMRRAGARTGRKLQPDERKGPAIGENLSDKVSLFQALEVRQERPDSDEPQSNAAAISARHARHRANEDSLDPHELVCYQRVEIFAFLFAATSILLAAISVAIGCCWRAAGLRRKRAAGWPEASARLQQAHKRARNYIGPPRSPIGSANLLYRPMISPSSTSSSSVSSLSPPLITPAAPTRGKHLVGSPQGRPAAARHLLVPARVGEQQAQHNSRANHGRARSSLASQERLPSQLDGRLLMTEAANRRN